MIVKIERLGINGEGIFTIPEGQDKGKICFVDFALPQETVEVEVIESKKKFCRAKLLRVINSSKDRVTPICPNFFDCGGCDLQHISTLCQNNFKIKKIADSLKLDSDCVELVTLNKLNYRNKMVFPFGINNGRNILGMFKKNTHDVTEINYCYLCSEKINKVLKISQEFFGNKLLSIYNRKSKNGLLKYLVVREIDNNILVTIICTKTFDFKDYYEVLCKSLKNVGLSLILSDSDDEILSGKYIHLFGLKQLNLNEFGIDYSIDNLGFLQVNNDIKKLLYTEVLNNINNSQNVIDAYSGAGLLSAIVSKKSKEVVAIEINKSACNSANNLIRKNNISNLKIVNADAGQAIKQYIDSLKNSVVILDPTRQGCCQSVLDAIINSNENMPSKIIYVSCNLATLARDLNILKEKYTVSLVKGYDMFYLSKHVETLVVLNKK